MHSFKHGVKAMVNPLDDVGREREAAKKASLRSKAGRDKLPFAVHTKAEVEKIIKELDEEIKQLKIMPAQDADALPSPKKEDDWALNAWEKEKSGSSKEKKSVKNQKKAAAWKVQREKRIRALKLYRDMLQVNIDLDADRIKAIKLTPDDVPKLEVFAPGRGVGAWRKFKYKLRPGRMAAKVGFWGSAAAVYMYYELIKEILLQGATNTQVLQMIKWWTAAHLEGIDTGPQVSFERNVDEIIEEVNTRYKLAWYRYGRMPNEMKKIAREKGIPFQKATKEDMRIIKARNNVQNKGLLSQVWTNLMSGMGGSAYSDPGTAEDAIKKRGPAGIPISPKDPKWFSVGNKLEESIDKNCKRSNKIKIKINS